MPPDDFKEKIELLVNDENRIVTYKILSQELKIHVNKAKQCLMDFFNAQKLKGIHLEVHYFLAGFIEADGAQAIKVIIVPEEKLESAKQSFSELTSFHIYSIYKGATKDECPLYSADFTYIKDKKEQNKYSAIKHPNIEIQPPVLNKIQKNSNINSNVQSPAPLDRSSIVASKNEPKSHVENSIPPEKSDNSEKQVKDSSEKKASPDIKQKPGTLMSMWQKKEEKSNNVKKDKQKTESKGKEAAKNVPKNSIMSMFSKQAAKNLERPPVSKSSISKDNEISKTAVPDVVQQENSSEKFIPKENSSEKFIPKENSSKREKHSENKKTSQKRKIPSKNSKGSSRKDSDSENEFQPKTKKKHRRICTFDSSDSESEPEEEKEKAQRSFFLPEEPMDAVESAPLTEDEEPIPPTPPVIHVKGRVRMWKTVQKTYEDEDGFLVTKTEKELVSASEDEEDPIKVNPVKKEEINNKKSVTVNKKQASLMSFFKQK